MPTKRTRRARNLVPDVSATALWKMSDGFYPEPEKVNQWELIVDNLEAPTLAFEANKALWEMYGAGIVTDWANEYPGTRPSWWWHFSAPRMTKADIERNGWGEWYFAREQHLPDPRRRTGGTGEPNYETENVTPDFEFGIPHFRAEDIDPDDPPAFESQASYLERHGLFMPGEKRRLRKQDFEDQVLSYSEITQRDAE